MPPLVKLILYPGYIMGYYLVALFLAARVGNSIGRYILISASLVLFGLSLIVGIEELSWALAYDFKLYSPALLFHRVAFYFCLFSGLVTFRCVCAAEIAQIYVWIGENDNAYAWTKTVSNILFEKQKIEFQSISRCGAVAFELGELELARKYLLTAVAEVDKDQSRISKQIAKLAAPWVNWFRSERLEQQAQNFDYLGKIALAGEQFDEAEKNFSRSAEVMKAIWFCNTLNAYEANAKATILIARREDPTEIAALVLEAASLMPERINLNLNVHVAFDLVRNLKKLDTDQTDLAATRLLARCITQMHANQKVQIRQTAGIA